MGELFSKTFNISINDPDPVVIQDAINAIRKISRNMTTAMNRLTKTLVENGVKIAKTKLGEFGIAEGQLYSSIRFEMEGGDVKTGYVLAGYSGDHESDNPKWQDLSYAVFVEYGFGTANYYDTAGGHVESQSRIDTYKENIDKYENSKIKKPTGRLSDHPSGRHPGGRYKDAEEYRVLVNSEGSSFYGWVYYDRKENRWRVSYGESPKPFMYGTLVKLAGEAAGQAKGIFDLFLRSV